MNTHEIEKFDTIYAKFTPKRTDDLQPGVDGWIGRACHWQAYWIIEDGPYEGQWAMSPDRDETKDLPCPFAWTPLCDLTPVSGP